MKVKQKLNGIKKIIGYLYYLSWIKHESFNPEAIMRCSLTWNCLRTKGKKRDSTLFWYCVYRLQANQMNQAITEPILRDDIIKKELKEMFNYCSKSKKYIVKEKYIETLRQKLNNCLSIRRFEKILSLVFEKNIKIDEKVE